MEPYSVLNDLQHSLGGQLQVILGALALLLVGWLIALFAGAGMRKLLVAFGVNRRLNANTNADQSYDFEKLGARVVFWFFLVIALVASLNLLNLQVVSAPFANMINEVLTFLPRIFAALILGLIAWVLAVAVRLGLTRVLAGAAAISADDPCGAWLKWPVAANPKHDGRRVGLYSKRVCSGSDWIRRLHGGQNCARHRDQSGRRSESTVRGATWRLE